MSYRWCCLVLLVALAVPLWADEDWTICPQFCRCKWVSGRKAAECTNSSYPGVPTTLSSEIQVLDLSGTALYELRADEFRRVNLSNLQKLFLRDCAIHTLHKEAFRGLAILIELYLTGNNIHTLHPSVFRDNGRLRILSLSRNPIEKLEDGLFSNMTHLQTVDLSGCRLSHIGLKTFVNTPILKNLILDGNNLTTMRVDTLDHLTILAGLVLHNNPWVCDCHLKEFRDWVMIRGLYAQPTSCEEPQFLNGRYWNDLNSDDLACKPKILFPVVGTTVEVDGGNVTLVCQVQGSPMPEVHWVFNSRIIGNYSSRTYGDQRYVVAESTDTTRWVNLTVTNVRHQDRGDYRCVAKSAGGIEERIVYLSVSHQHGAGGGSDTGVVMGQWPLIIGLVAGLLFLSAAVLLGTYWYCRRRNNSNSKTSTKKTPNDGILSSNGDIGGYTGSSEQEKSLLTKVNPVQKPPRRHERPTLTSTATESAEVKSNLLDNGSVFFGDGSTVASEERLEDRSIDSMETALQQHSQDGLDVESGPLDNTTHTYPPDLLSFPSPAYQVSPAGSTASTAPDSTHLPAQHGPQSPVHSPIYHGHPVISGTLPYSRSHSPFSPVVLPRQGYVTIPRRPRVPSWSSAPSPTPVGSDLTLRFEPAYDNLGPRTTADGSSVLSLNKSPTSDSANQVPSSARARPLPQAPNYHNSSHPAFYAPIEEQEVQPSPTLPRANAGTRGSLRRSTPNINVTPSASPVSQVSTSSRSSKPDKADPRHRDSWTARSAPEGASLKRREDEPGTSGKRNSLVTSPPGATLPNGLSREAKVPPKPPPKPKKKNTENVKGPLFEDEGEDGTEV